MKKVEKKAKKEQNAAVFRQTFDRRGRLLQWFHEVNMQYPWLKVALVVLMILLPLNEAAQAQKVEEARAPTRAVALNLKAPARKRNLEGKKLVALTFDDGPLAATTPQLLDILEKKQAPATFFVVGTMAERAPEVLKREQKEGHEVGSHTTAHRSLATMSVGEIQAEKQQMNSIVERITGKGVSLVRPPYGALSDTVRGTMGQAMILWSVDPEDWRDRKAETVRTRVREMAHDGAVILLHDIHPTTVEAVPGIIDDLRADGYEFVTVSELAEAKKVKLESGKVYRSF